MAGTQEEKIQQLRGLPASTNPPSGADFIVLSVAFNITGAEVYLVKTREITTSNFVGLQINRSGDNSPVTVAGNPAQIATLAANGVTFINGTPASIPTDACGTSLNIEYLGGGTPGTYPVVFTATSANGNTSSVTLNFIIS